MKEKMDKNSIDALIGYMCQRSDEAIQEAELLFNRASTYYTLFEKRHSSDYDDFIYFDHEMTQELIALTKEFTSTMKEMVTKSRE